MTKVILALFIALFLVVLLPHTVSAQGVSAYVTKNKRSFSATFTNLTKVKTFTYTLSYDSAAGPQGSQGSINVKSGVKRLTRNFLLGSCSRKVCIYHKNIKNLKLNVNFTLNSGKVVRYERKFK